MNVGPEPVSWPIVTLDFEASALDDRSYPIEVGICRWPSPSHPIEGWSTIIAPTERWRANGSWWYTSQAIHGIRPGDLAGGMTADNAMRMLNRIVGSGIAYCDGDDFDVQWMARLAKASDVPQAFVLGAFDDLCDSLDQFGYMRLRRWLERAPAEHRARRDAERLMKGIARGLRLKHGTSVGIEAAS